LKTQYKETKKKMDELCIPYSKGENCPTCQQEILESALSQFEEEVNHQKKELELIIEDITKNGKALKSDLAEAIKENEEIERKYKEELDIYLNRKKLLSQLHQQKKEEVQKIKQENEKIITETEQKTVELNKETRMKLQALRDHLQELELANQEHINISKSVAKAEGDRFELLANKERAEQTIDKNKEAIKCLNEYVAVYAELQEKQITQHFEKVSIQLSEIVKTTGEIKPKFKLLYDGKPIEALSLSERIRLGLEVAGFIKTVTNIAYPTFIDNAESITHFNDTPGQLFTATVVKGEKLSLHTEEKKVC